MKTFTDGFARNSLRYQYGSVGVYDVTISAINDVEPREKRTKCTVFVEDPIANLSFGIPPPRIKNGSQDMYIAVGESISVEGSIASGTSVFCDFDFGEKVLNGGINVFSQSYTYRKPGHYIVSLSCTNRVSNMYRKHSTSILVQEDEPISNLRLLVNVTSKGTDSVFELVMRTGTAFVCNWTLGDNTAFQTDVSDMDTPVLHRYTKEGVYDTSVRCENRHGLFVAQSVAWVQIPIVDLTCVALQQYIVTLEEASFNISVKSGSHVTVATEFENNQTESVTFRDGFVDWKSFILKHLYLSNGSFIVVVNASNLLGKLSATCRPIVIVQNPLLNMTLSANRTIMKVSEDVAFSLRISVSRYSLPSDASCSWAFGDNSSVNGRPLIFNHEESVILHRYLSPGKFITYVSCSNEVSRIALNTTVTVLKLIKPYMKVCLSCNYSTDIKTISYMKYFTLGDEVTFVTTSQAFDRAFLWKMTGYGELAITKMPFCSVILTKAGTFTANVVIDKVVENMSATVEFIVQEKIHGVEFSSSGSTWLRTATLFELALPKFDDGSCFVATLNDSFRSNISHCSKNTTNYYTFSFSHTYRFEGNYSVCLAVFNKVSEEKRCLVVSVSRPVCKIENVSIWESDSEVKKTEESVLQLLKYNKSEQFQLNGRYINKCALRTSRDVKLLWIVKKLIDANREAEIVRKGTGSSITVNARSLPYGEYLFTFVVELTSPDVKTLYGQVIANATGKVEIILSPLIGRIAGETRQNVNKEETLTIDASFHDPDLPPGNDQKGMQFTWFCRTQHFAHCYDNTLSPDIFIKILNTPIFATTLHRYVANKTYIFKVKVTKGDRAALTDEVEIFVLPPPPPPPPTPPPPPKMKIRSVRWLTATFPYSPAKIT